jgi:hypothetical protein
MHNSTFEMRVLCKINVAELKFLVYNVEELLAPPHLKEAASIQKPMIQRGFLVQTLALWTIGARL